MKVCFVVPSLAGGGAERVAVTVLSALNPERFERVLYLFSNEGVYFDRIARDVTVVVAKAQSWPGRLFELTRFLRASRPDVVMPFLSYFITALAAWLAGGRSRMVFNQGTPTSGFLDDPDFKWRGGWRRSVFAAATRFAYRRADAIVVTSEGVAADLAERYSVPRPLIRVLHNPVDLEAITRSALTGIAIADDGPVVVSAGRLAGVKNFGLLLDAIARLQPPPRAWILGDGEERAALEQQVAALGLSSRVRFVGFQDNPWAWIAKADVFVLTSVYEGFGNVLVEAMACGTPVVATRSSGTVEIIDDGVNGMLVDASPDSVAAAIDRVLSDRLLRDRLIARALADVQHYALPLVAARYQQLFEQVAA